MAAEVIQSGPRKSDKWIPWYFVAFFVVLAILDGIFVYIATQTHTGVVTENAYQKGLAYNETIAEVAAQAELGWRTDMVFENGQLIITLLDASGESISGASAQALFFRPTQDGKDFRVVLSEQANGKYTVPVMPGQGQWDVRVYITWKQAQYQTVKRIVVPKQ